MIPDYLARYPFLKESKGYLKEIKLSEILQSPAYSRIRNLSVERVKASYTGKMPRMVDKEERFLTYHLAKLVLVALEDPVITRKYANMERDALERNLNVNPEDADVIAEDLGLRYRRINRIIEHQVYHYELHFIDFIKYAKNFSTEDFMLINQVLNKGKVLLQRDRFIKILREAFVDKFVEDVEKSKEYSDLLKRYLRRELDEIRNLKDEYISKYTPIEFGSVETDAFPPCMKSIMAKISDGVNVSHQARFSLVAFLHRIGMKEEEILKVFASVPDFKRDLTIYQIRHITGKISGKEYSVPKCATMRSYGLCVRDITKDKLCAKPWMTHPLLYYKIKAENLRKGTSRQK